MLLTMGGYDSTQQSGTPLDTRQRCVDSALPEGVVLV